MSAEERCDRFELEVTGVNVPFSLNKRLKGLRHSFTVHHLQPNAVYRIRVRASDGLQNNIITNNTNNNNEAHEEITKTTTTTANGSSVAVRHGC